MELDEMNNKQRLVLTYRLSFSLGSFLFTLATLATFPSSDQQIFNPLFKLLIKLSACCMIVAEVCELIARAVAHCRFVIFSIALAGNLTFIWSTIQYEQFNKGEAYLISAFLVSFAYQLKDLSLVIKAYNFKDLIMRHRNKFIRLTFVAFGQIVFLAGSVMLLLELDSLIQKLVTILGGILISVPILIGFQRNRSKGYAEFNYSMQIPRIV